MRRGKEDRIAIFQAGWPLHSQTTNCAAMFAEAGYEVDLFLYQTSDQGPYARFEVDRLRNLCHVHVHRLAPPSTEINGAVGRRDRLKSIAKSVAPFLLPMLRGARDSFKSLRWSEEEFLPRRIVSEAMAVMAGKQYRCLIGVEKKGLIWAGRIAQTLPVPYMYFSLELYTEDHWRVRRAKDPQFKRLRKTERAYHRKAAATIIQDPDRAHVLFQSNRLSLSKAKVFYVPVSSLGTSCTRRSSFLQESFGIPRERKVILYFGQIWEKRYVLELAQEAQQFPEDWVLVMHGWGQGPAIDSIRALDSRRRVVLSLELLSSQGLRELIASADIGLAFYSPEIQNDRLTAFSSEKMALYMQCGVPFIAFDYPGYRRLAEEHGCGTVIQTMSELPAAVRIILEGYKTFRRNAFQAFSRYYDYANNFARVIEGVKHLA